VIAHVALFFLYTGLEVAAGQWTYTLLTEARGVEPAMAGAWTSVYWGSLTAGRLALASLVPRIPIDRLLRGATTIAPLGALLIWVGERGPLVGLGVVGLGLSLAPVYPLLVSATPHRVGHRDATYAIGAQIAAACLGAAALPGAVGLLARAQGLEVIGPALTAAAFGVLVLHEAILRAMRIDLPRAAVQPPGGRSRRPRAPRTQGGFP
jgi:fucose permease